MGTPDFLTRFESVFTPPNREKLSLLETGDPKIRGTFESYQAECGYTHAGKNTSSLYFYSIRLNQRLKLPLWLSDRCPIGSDGGTGLKAENLAVTELGRFVEYAVWVDSDEDAENHWKQQNEASVKQTFTKLAALAHQLESGTLTCEAGIAVMKNNMKRDLKKFLAIAAAAAIVIGGQIYFKYFK